MYLTVCVLDGGNVGLAEGALDEPKDERALAHASWAKHDHAVVTALGRHPDVPRTTVTPQHSGTFQNQDSFSIWLLF